VGVVLGCNNYEVIDLGVMVPMEKILAVAAQEKVDIIGLSGLITPSLDEMVSIAAEMERIGCKTPLLIGGATTSRRHTAIKIAPEYSGIAMHVADASRVPPIVGELVDPERAESVRVKLAEEQADTRARYERRQGRAMLSFEQSRANRLEIDWSTYTPPAPEFTGVREVEVELAELVPYIDWSPFFSVWELPGGFPRVLEHPDYGSSAREVYEHGKKMLGEFIERQQLTAKGVYGFFPAAADNEQVVIYSDPERRTEATRFTMLRQQRVKEGKEQSNLALSDFIAPVDSGRADFLGGFAVTAGIGISDLVAAFDATHDDYNSIMAKAIADRLAEAFAEYLHEKARTEWGIGEAPRLSAEALIREEYRGIRPAPGYPACPDHHQKFRLWELLGAEARAGIRLTESAAMWPAASVSGWYFSHPESRYFTVGPIGKDQVSRYAELTGMPLTEAERWLSPLLSYK
ncbi:MAG: cobalamin-dependent protein, partial [Myxococcales bacterium]|nr:cobalamin-dependent protein [Myxococcales bacterium]